VPGKLYKFILLKNGVKFILFSKNSNLLYKKAGPYMNPSKNIKIL